MLAVAGIDSLGAIAKAEVAPAHQASGALDFAAAVLSNTTVGRLAGSISPATVRDAAITAPRSGRFDGSTGVGTVTI